MQKPSIAKLSLWLLTSSSFLAAAAPDERFRLSITATTTNLERRQGTSMPASQCPTGQLVCCNSLQRADSQEASAILALIGTSVAPGSTRVGLTCSPISVIGVGGNQCTGIPLCCTVNGFFGLISIGCTPVDLNL